MSIIATAFDTMFTFVALVAFAMLVSLITLAYANNELFIIVITEGTEAIMAFGSKTENYIRSTF
jgi:hypothetical protein